MLEAQRHARMPTTTRKMKTIAILVCAAILATGCAGRRAAALYAPLPFDAEEYAALPKTGTGTVKGQVFAKTVGGDVKKGAGNVVALLPATSFRKHWYSESYLPSRPASVAPDVRHEAYDKEKTTDGEGRFEFTDVPPGQYFVLSSVKWETVSSNQYSRRLGLTDSQGGYVVRQIEVKNGATTDAILSR